MTTQPLYGFDADDVGRIKRLLEDYEGGRLMAVDPPPRGQRGVRVETYLAKSTGTITALATTSIVRTGTTVSGTFLVTGLSTTTDLFAGMTVTGTGIPSGATIVSVDSASQVSLSGAATASGSPSLTFACDTFGSGPVDLYGLQEGSDGKFRALDTAIPETAYNSSTTAIASGTYLTLVREPGSGRLLPAQSSGGGGGGGGGIATINLTILTSASGTYTRPAKLLYAIVEVQGGGGGGGGASAAFADGGGGQAGGYTKKLVAAGSLGATQAYSVGAGGAGATGAANGTTGGDSQFGIFGTGAGGVGGSGGITLSHTNAGLTYYLGQGNGGIGGGSATNGDVNLTGEAGWSAQTQAIYNGATPYTQIYVDTRGGSTPFGSGGNGGAWSTTPDGDGYGTGGGGANFGNTGGVGGNGRNGLILVWEFLSP